MLQHLKITPTIIYGELRGWALVNDTSLFRTFVGAHMNALKLALLTAIFKIAFFHPFVAELNLTEAERISNPEPSNET